eukprot:14406661-Alexandrium_andersonii.AAC.1
MPRARALQQGDIGRRFVAPQSRGVKGSIAESTAPFGRWPREGPGGSSLDLTRLGHRGVDPSMTYT